MKMQTKYILISASLLMMIAAIIIYIRLRQGGDDKSIGSNTSDTDTDNSTWYNGYKIKSADELRNKYSIQF